MKMDTVTVNKAWDAYDIQVNEQDISKSTCTVYYIVQNAASESEAINAVRDDVSQEMTIPGTTSTLPLQSISVSERLTENDWKVEVNYASAEKSGSSGGSGSGSSSNESTYNFDISAGTKKIIYPVSHKKTYPADAEAPSAGINDGEGTEIIMPVGHFSETHYMSNAKCTAAYRKKVTKMVGKINSSAFKGYAAGEVLFMGASGSKTGNDKWQVTFNFSVNSAQSNLTIGNITGVSKDAWDIIWAQYTEEENSDKTEIVKKVKAVHVEQVYESANFGELGL